MHDKDKTDSRRLQRGQDTAGTNDERGGGINRHQVRGVTKAHGEQTRLKSDTIDIRYKKLTRQKMSHLVCLRWL